jgi:uncharacterized protein
MLLSVLLILSLRAGTVLANGPKFPPLTGRVVDDAGILSDDTRATLSDMLAEHERKTGNQVVVVTLKDLQGYPIETFGYQLGRTWGIGQKGKNNGVLLIVVPKAHKVRIEVGYGFEGSLTDAASRGIIERDILPEFRLGLFDSGILAGVNSILRVLGGNPAEAGATTPSPNEMRALKNPQVNPLYLALALMFPFLPFALIFGLIAYIATHTQSGSGGGYDHDSFGGSGGGSGGGSSGGGFSGGGGSFGGGGATGSW